MAEQDNRRQGTAIWGGIVPRTRRLTPLEAATMFVADYRINGRRPAIDQPTFAEDSPRVGPHPDSATFRLQGSAVRYRVVVHDESITVRQLD